MSFFPPVTFFPRSRQSLTEAQVTVHFSPLSKASFLTGHRFEIVQVRMAFRIYGEVWNREKGKDTQRNHHHKAGAEYEGHKWPQIPLDTFLFRWLHVFIFTQHNNIHRAFGLFYGGVMLISTGNLTTRICEVIWVDRGCGFWLFYWRFRCEFQE